MKMKCILIFEYDSIYTIHSHRKSAEVLESENLYDNPTILLDLVGNLKPGQYEVFVKAMPPAIQPSERNA